MKILLVDDHELFRDGLAGFVREAIPGATVVEADDCRMAEGLVNGGGVDMALVDLRLPDGSGVELIGRLAAIDPLLPVVVISALDDREVVERSLNAGASGFLPKQLSREAMTDALARILAGEVWSPYDEGAGIEPPPVVPSSVGERLTPRQREVLALLVEGLPNKLIARRLGMAEKTVKAHLSAVFAALDVRNRAEAVARTLAPRGSV